MKTKMNHVYYNRQTNVMGLKELNSKGMMLKSDIKLGEEAKQDEDGTGEATDEGISQRVLYSGSSFQQGIQ